MLTNCKKFPERAYTDFQLVTFGEELPWQDSFFDIFISVGTFSVGGPPPGSFDDIIRIVRSGGVVLFTVTDLHHDWYENARLLPKIADLVDSGAWHKVLETQPEVLLPGDADEVQMYQIFAFQVQKNV